MASSLISTAFKKAGAFNISAEESRRIISADRRAKSVEYTFLADDISNGLLRLSFTTIYPAERGEVIQISGTTNLTRWRLFGTAFASAPLHHKLNQDNKRLVDGTDSSPSELAAGDDDIWVPFDLTTGAATGGGIWANTHPFAALFLAGVPVADEFPKVFLFAK